MNRKAAVGLPHCLHKQTRYYAGGPDEVAKNQIAGCWLLSLGQRAFDAAWSGDGGQTSVSNLTQPARSKPSERAALGDRALVGAEGFGDAGTRN